MSNILVTGTAGFLGSAIVQYLHNKGHVTFSIGHRDNFYENLLDITSKNNIDIVVHAGFSVDFSIKSNDENINVISARELKKIFENKNISQFIFISAAAVLGVSNGPRQRGEEHFNTCDQDFSLWMQSNYVKDKIACESILGEISPNYCCLYLSTVYGLGMPQSTLGALFGGPPLLRPVPPGGTSYLVLSDFLEALDLVILNKVQGCYVLNSGNIRYKKLLSLSDEISKKYRIIIRIPFFVQRFIQKLPLRASFISSKSVILSTFGYKYYSPQKAMRTFHFHPKGDLKETLKDLFVQRLS